MAHKAQVEPLVKAAAFKSKLLDVKTVVLTTLGGSAGAGGIAVGHFLK